MNLFQRLAARKKLVDTFRLFTTYTPNIHSVTRNRYVFTIPNGMNPNTLTEHVYVFQQMYGANVELAGDHKRFTLTLNKNRLPAKVRYDYAELAETIEQDRLIFPIVSGAGMDGKVRLYDATNNPNLLIFGEPGSGKSSMLHAILCTLMQRFSPAELELYLGDFKMSELNIYEGAQHVKSISYLPSELAPALAHIQRQMTARGELLKEHRVRHINKLPAAKKPPYIMLCIDEFVMIRDDDIMADLLQIASLGRAYGIYLTLSMQRPSHKILSTDVRGVLSVRMGFKTVDARNAAMGETPGSELISRDQPGTFLLNIGELAELKAPYLDESKVEKILAPYQVADWRNHSFKKKAKKAEAEPAEPTEILTEKDVFNDVNEA